MLVGESERQEQAWLWPAVQGLAQVDDHAIGDRCGDVVLFFEQCYGSRGAASGMRTSATARSISFRRSRRGTRDSARLDSPT